MSPLWLCLVVPFLAVPAAADSYKIINHWSGGFQADACVTVTKELNGWTMHIKFTEVFLMNPYDIAPRYATAILSLSNTVAVATGIISPYVVAALTTDKSREQWQRVFFLTSGICIACLLFYLIFGSGTEMEWARAVTQDKQIEVPTAEKEPLKEKDDEENGRTSAERDLDRNEELNHHGTDSPVEEIC